MYGRKGGTGGGAGTTDWTSIWETPIQGTVRQLPVAGAFGSIGNSSGAGLIQQPQSQYVQQQPEATKAFTNQSQSANPFITALANQNAFQAQQQLGIVASAAPQNAAPVPRNPQKSTTQGNQLYEIARPDPEPAAFDSLSMKRPIQQQRANNYSQNNNPFQQQSQTNLRRYQAQDDNIGRGGGGSIDWQLRSPNINLFDPPPPPPRPKEVQQSSLTSLFTQQPNQHQQQPHIPSLFNVMQQQPQPQVDRLNVSSMQSGGQQFGNSLFGQPFSTNTQVFGANVAFPANYNAAPDMPHQQQVNRQGGQGSFPFSDNSQVNAQRPFSFSSSYQQLLDHGPSELIAAPTQATFGAEKFAPQNLTTTATTTSTTTSGASELSWKKATDLEPGGIITTNLTGLLDIIASSNKPKESDLIPGLGDLPLSEEGKAETNKAGKIQSSPAKSSETNCENSGIQIQELQAKQISNNNYSSANAINSATDTSVERANSVRVLEPIIKKFQSANNQTNLASNGSSPQIKENEQKSTGRSDVAEGSQVDMEFSEADKRKLEAFDKNLQNWEQQFQNWKSANQNHPDRQAYATYLAQWNDMRSKMMEQRNSILTEIRKSKNFGVPGTQQFPLKVTPVSSSVKDAAQPLVQNPNSIAQKVNKSESPEHPQASPDKSQNQKLQSQPPEKVSQIEEEEPEIVEILQTSKPQENTQKLINPATSEAATTKTVQSAPKTPEVPKDLEIEKMKSFMKSGTIGSEPIVAVQNVERVTNPTQSLQNQGVELDDGLMQQPMQEHLHHGQQIAGKTFSTFSTESTQFGPGPAARPIVFGANPRHQIPIPRQPQPRQELGPVLRQPLAQDPRLRNPRPLAVRAAVDLGIEPDWQNAIARRRMLLAEQQHGEEDYDEIDEEEDGDVSLMPQYQGQYGPMGPRFMRPPSLRGYRPAGPGLRPVQMLRGPRPRFPVGEPIYRVPLMRQMAPIRPRHLIGQEDELQLQYPAAVSAYGRPTGTEYATRESPVATESLFTRRPVASRARPDIETDSRDNEPLVIDYGHGDPLQAMFSRERRSRTGTVQSAQQITANDDEDDDDAGAVIDYGHGAQAPKVITKPEDHSEEEKFHARFGEDYYDEYAEPLEPPIELEYANPSAPSARGFPIRERGFPPIMHGGGHITQMEPRYAPIVDYTFDHQLPQIGLDVEEPVTETRVRNIRIAPPLDPSEIGAAKKLSPETELRRAPPRDLEPQDFPTRPKRIVHDDLEQISPESSPRTDQSRGRRDDRPREREKYRDGSGRLERSDRSSRNRSRERERKNESPRRSGRRDESPRRIQREDSPRRGRRVDSPRRRGEESPRRRNRDRDARKSRSRSPPGRINYSNKTLVSRNPSPSTLLTRQASNPTHSAPSYQTVLVEDILNLPGRKKRPHSIFIILRGLPGSGKTHVAKLIKDREVEQGGSAPRILSLDDYFMTGESEKVKRDSVTGKESKEKVATYEYDQRLETKYRDSMFRTFKKTIESGLFRFIILDSVNDKVRHFDEFVNYAQLRKFQVYVAELENRVEDCFKRNIHNRTREEIQNIAKHWEKHSYSLTKLDIRPLLQDEAVQDVEMEDVSDTENFSEGNKVVEGSKEIECIELDDEEDEPVSTWVKSKWETSEENMNKLDGLMKKKKSDGNDDDAPSTQQSLESWLQSHLPEDYNIRRETTPGKKRVRWADIEERREQERAREIGFVVGHTDWNRFTDPTFGDSALTKTKFI